MKEEFKQAVSPSDGLAINSDFNQAAAKDREKPEERKPGMHLRPDGATVEAVHSALERQGLGHVSPQLSDEVIAQEFRQRLLQERFNRSAKGLESEKEQDSDISY